MGYLIPFPSNLPRTALENVYSIYGFDSIKWMGEKSPVLPSAAHKDLWHLFECQAYPASYGRCSIPSIRQGGSKPSTEDVSRPCLSRLHPDCLAGIERIP